MTTWPALAAAAGPCLLQCPESATTSTWWEQGGNALSLPAFSPGAEGGLISPLQGKIRWVHKKKCTNTQNPNKPKAPPWLTAMALKMVATLPEICSPWFYSLFTASTWIVTFWSVYKSILKLYHSKTLLPCNHNAQGTQRTKSAHCTRTHKHNWPMNKTEFYLHCMLR